AQALTAARPSDTAFPRSRDLEPSSEYAAVLDRIAGVHARVTRPSFFCNPPRPDCQREKQRDGDGTDDGGPASTPRLVVCATPLAPRPGARRGGRAERRRADPVQPLEGRV